MEAILVSAIFFVLWLVVQIWIGRSRQEHREETGVDTPARQALARIRRKAREQGFSVDEAYDQWLVRKKGGPGSRSKGRR